MSYSFTFTGGDKVTINNKKRIVIGISGASGAILAVELLQILRETPDYETHLVISRGAEATILQETKYSVAEVAKLADTVYDINAIGASLASGTFKTEGMIIIPCSMKTVAGIACGYSDNLLLRAADVTIKEGRRLVLVARECPFSAIHLRNMLTLAEAGAVIMPPVVSYYTKATGIEAMHRQIIGRILEKFSIEVKGFSRWCE
jgi:4-hydroxy-3-polyprenylbenzoate decarboxylase